MTGAALLNTPAWSAAAKSPVMLSSNLNIT